MVTSTIGSDPREVSAELTIEAVHGLVTKKLCGGWVRVDSERFAIYAPDGEVYILSITHTDFPSLGRAYDRLTAGSLT